MISVIQISNSTWNNIHCPIHDRLEKLINPHAMQWCREGTLLNIVAPIHRQIVWQIICKLNDYSFKK